MHLTSDWPKIACKQLTTDGSNWEGGLKINNRARRSIAGTFRAALLTVTGASHTHLRPTGRYGTVNAGTISCIFK